MKLLTLVTEGGDQRHGKQKWEATVLAKKFGTARLA